MLSLAELEEMRDELAGRVAHLQRSLSDRTYAEEQKRGQI